MACIGGASENDVQKSNLSSNHSSNNALQQSTASAVQRDKKFTSNLQKQLNQISHQNPALGGILGLNLHEPTIFTRSFFDGDFEFVSIAFHFHWS